MHNHTNTKRSTSNWMMGLALAFFLFSTLGCGPTLSVNKTVDVEPSGIHSALIDPVGVEQTITVEATGSTSFKIHIHLSEDQDAVDLAIASGKESDKILAGKSDVKTATLSALIPANKEASVRFESGSKKSSIIYSISN